MSSGGAPGLARAQAAPVSSQVPWFDSGRGGIPAEIAACMVGGAYLFASWLAPTQLAGIALVLSGPDSTSASSIAVLQALVAMFFSVVVVGLAVTSFGASLGRALRPATFGSRLVALFLATFLARWALDLVGLWQWTWRWPGGPGLAVSAAIVEQHRILAGVGVLLVGVLAIPMVEETVFRFAALRLLQRMTGRTGIAIVSGAALFALVHLGPHFHPHTPAVIHTMWLFAFGLLASYLTVQQRGSVASAIVMHAALNAAEAGTLLGALSLAS